MPHGGGDNPLDRERQRRAESGLHHKQGRDRGPIGLGHLHEPRNNY